MDLLFNHDRLDMEAAKMQRVAEGHEGPTLNSTIQEKIILRTPKSPIALTLELPPNLPMSPCLPGLRGLSSLGVPSGLEAAQVGSIGNSRASGLDTGSFKRVFMSLCL